MSRLAAGNSDSRCIKGAEFPAPVPVEEGKRGGLQFLVVHDAFSSSVTGVPALSRQFAEARLTEAGSTGASVVFGNLWDKAASMLHERGWRR
ncbi:hypothetical protein BN2476_1730007 [Paraburkholderia piptadeniae]|uniref:Uncharacterized protein n=1 Tax=Paraburkholderia piptadeniae TaxID=1701573 RepID=A0A1N7SX93_9BURK|nr:hypothetical protein BN2476_1730007 [Paraburkholderia piptadeniae]